MTVTPDAWLHNMKRQVFIIWKPCHFISLAKQIPVTIVLSLFWQRFDTVATFLLLHLKNIQWQQNVKLILWPLKLPILFFVVGQNEIIYYTWSKMTSHHVKFTIFRDEFPIKAQRTCLNNLTNWHLVIFFTEFDILEGQWPFNL